MLHGRTALQNDPSVQSFDALDFRVLLILFVFYRKWVAHRLWCLGSWVEARDIPELNAGVPGRGAEDAWYTRGIAIEYARCMGYAVSGGVVDIAKCFDQVSRLLVQSILLIGGMPRPVVGAYIRFHDNLLVYNMVAGNLGRPYKKRFSIPQGCPFSMMIIALLLRGMVSFASITNVLACRLLADDFILVGLGQDHVGPFTHKFEAAATYIRDMGS